MLFGQPANRVNFVRPQQMMPGYRPQLPTTNFFSHFHPFQQIMGRMVAASAYQPQLPVQMGPGTMQSVAATPPALPAPAAASMPMPGPTAGFGAAGFGASFGGGGGSPYRTMRTGMIPGINPNMSNIRSGASSAGQLVRQQLPAATMSQLVRQQLPAISQG